VVIFEIAGKTWPLEDSVAERLAVAFRLSLTNGSNTEHREGCVFLADAIEARLVGTSTEPIRMDEGTALALFQQLNASLRDPDSIDPAYSLYLEVRRYLGRLYSWSTRVLADLGAAIVEPRSHAEDRKRPLLPGSLC
jgi:hypothetical protein